MSRIRSNGKRNKRKWLYKPTAKAMVKGLEYSDTGSTMGMGFIIHMGSTMGMRSIASLGFAI